MKMSPMLGPIVREQRKHMALVASVLKHKSNVGTTLVKVASPIVFSIITIPVQ